MQEFEVFIPEIDDHSFVEAPSPRSAARIRLKKLEKLDPDLYLDQPIIAVIVHDELGKRATFHIRLHQPQARYKAALVGW